VISWENSLKVSHRIASYFVTSFTRRFQDNVIELWRGSGEMVVIGWEIRLVNSPTDRGQTYASWMGCCSPIRSMLHVHVLLCLHSVGIKCYSDWFHSPNSSKNCTRTITCTHNLWVEVNNCLAVKFWKDALHHLGTTHMYGEPFFLLSSGAYTLNTEVPCSLTHMGRLERPPTSRSPLRLRTSIAHIVAALSSFTYFHMHFCWNYWYHPIARTLSR